MTFYINLSVGHQGVDAGHAKMHGKFLDLMSALAGIQFQQDKAKLEHVNFHLQPSFQHKQPGIVMGCFVLTSQTSPHQSRSSIYNLQSDQFIVSNTLEPMRYLKTFHRDRKELTGK